MVNFQWEDKLRKELPLSFQDKPRNRVPVFDNSAWIHDFNVRGRSNACECGSMGQYDASGDATCGDALESNAYLRNARRSE